MSKLVLPAVIKPPRFKNDGSATISFDTRELTAEETHIILASRHLEGWVAFAPNPDELETPDEVATVDGLKSPSSRLRDVLFVWYKQQIEDGIKLGLFDTFYKEKVEQLIEFVKGKLK